MHVGVHLYICMYLPLQCTLGVCADKGKMRMAELESPEEVNERTVGRDHQGTTQADGADRATFLCAGRGTQKTGRGTCVCVYMAGEGKRAVCLCRCEGVRGGRGDVRVYMRRGGGDERNDTCGCVCVYAYTGQEPGPVYLCVFGRVRTGKREVCMRMHILCVGGRGALCLCRVEYVTYNHT